MPHVTKARSDRSRRLAIEALEDRTTPSAGTLDLTFGVRGQVTTDVGPAPIDIVSNVLIDAADRIVATGYSEGASGDCFAVARYLPDGTLDPSFGDGGKVRTDLGPGDNTSSQSVLDGAGRILVVGYRSDPAGEQMALVRYLPDGSLDADFGQGGVVLTRFGQQRAYGRGVAIDAAGRVLVAGTVQKDSPTDWSNDVFVARFLPDGTPDGSFGDGGRVFTNFGFGNTLFPTLGTTDYAEDMVIDEAGRIVVAGMRNAAQPDAILARYLPDGSLDPTFGDGGKVVTSYAQPSLWPMAMTLDAAGNVVLAGLAFPHGGYSDRESALLRYLPDGTPDPAFGTGGLVLTRTGDFDDEFMDVAVDSDGRLIAVGDRKDQAGDFDFSVARYLPDGSLDPAFGVGGLVFTPFGGTKDVASGLALDRFGRIVAGGTTGSGGTNTSPYDFALARYHNGDYPGVNTSAGDVAYVENDPATPVDGQLTVTTLGNHDLVGATVQVDNFRPDQDVIGYSLRPGIAAVFDPSSGQLTLTGTAPVADYEAVLRSVTYRNTSEAPDTRPRTFVFAADDGDPDAALGAGPKIVRVTSVNDVPVLSGVPAAATVVRGTTWAMTATATDADDPAAGLTFGLVGAPAGATLDPATGVVSWTPGGGVSPGEYAFAVTVSDGHVTTVRPVVVRVPWASVVAGDLVVGGSDGRDVLAVGPAADADRIAVSVGGQAVESFARSAVTGRVVVRGFGGADAIAIDPQLVLPADLDGGAGNDTLTGGSANDVLTGGTGNDVLVGGRGDDRYAFADGWGVDRVTDAAGSDGFDFAGTTGGVRVRIGSPVSAVSGANTVTVRGAVENLVGGAGPDTFAFAAGARLARTINGGPGADTLSYAGYLTPVTVNLRLGTATGAGGMSAIEDVVGGSAADVLVGDAGANRLTGGGGRDVLIGGAGADVLVGEAGDDLLIAGPTGHDSSPTALAAIRSEWVRPIGYVTRVAHLLGAVPGGRNGSVLLDPANLTDDGEANVLTGGFGTDWFLGFAGDAPTDLRAGETVTSG